MVVDVDSFARRLRKPRMETREEINQQMLSVELAVKEALSARGETHFTDQEFPPNDQSLFVDPENPPLRLKVTYLNYSFPIGYDFYPSYAYVEIDPRLFLSG